MLPINMNMSEIYIIWICKWWERQ